MVVLMHSTYKCHAWYHCLRSIDTRFNKIMILSDGQTRALLRLERTMNLFGGRGREGGREGEGRGYHTIYITI